MDKDKLLELPYNALRNQIEQTRDRIFRITIAGATIAPAAQFLVSTYNVVALTKLDTWSCICLERAPYASPEARAVA